MSQRHTIGNGQLRTEVGYHTTNMVFICAEVAGTFPAFTETVFAALPLHEQFIERHFNF
jgi:hypothetical protein